MNVSLRASQQDSEQIWTSHDYVSSHASYYKMEQATKKVRKCHSSHKQITKAWQNNKILVGQKETFSAQPFVMPS
jgi:hypothetical protein